AAQQALGPHTMLRTDLLPGSERDYLGAQDNLRIDLGPNVVFRNIVSYGTNRFRTAIDGDGTPLTLFQFVSGSPFKDHYQEYSEELQFQGRALKGNLTWTAGALYLDNPGVGSSDTTVFGFETRLFTRIGSRSEGLYTQETYDLSS